MRRVHAPARPFLRLALLLLCPALGHAEAFAQENKPAGERHAEQVKTLLASPEIVKALAHIDSGREQILKEWIAITEVNAPSGKERP
ncbi:MAG TPA: hypothetical protein VF240_12595, partial [Pyrinomonadaceae bacterium]